MDDTDNNQLPGETVVTHFGTLHTERISPEIAPEEIPGKNIGEIVQGFLSSLNSNDLYVNHELIGEGGMGSVERVKDTSCLRTIALKTLHKDKSTEESCIRFADEAQITAQLEHPNIIPVYDFGVDKEDQLYYTMKMIKGRNLKDILRSIKNDDKDTVEQFPLSRLLEIFISICDAMSYACSHKVIHRDLKPENIMIGNFGEVYIVDWGLAKIIEDEPGTVELPEWILKEVSEKESQDVSKTIKELRKVKSLRMWDKAPEISLNNVLVGTPHYMAPERISGVADERSEVYALGAILYNILTLELSIQGENLEDILLKISAGDIKHPLAFDAKFPHLTNGRIPPGLAAVTMKALNVLPEMRYQKVAHLRMEISRWQDGFQTEAEKAGAWMSLWSLMKRNRKESYTAAAALGILICIFTIYVFSLKKEKNIALNARKNAIEQKKLLDSSTEKLSEKSFLTQEKISELTSLAPELYTRSQNLIKAGRANEAVNLLDSAIRLQPDTKYYVAKANLFQLQGKFLGARRIYERILKIQPELYFLEESLTFCLEFEKKQMSSYTDHLRFYRLLQNQSRHSEAVIIQRKLLSLGKNLKRRILSNFSGTALNFVTEEMILLSPDGTLVLNLENRNISDIAAFEGIPFSSLNLAGNPISDLESLKGMPLTDLNISRTKIDDISVLRGMNLKTLVADNSKIQNLNPLRSSPLQFVSIRNTEVSSLSGLNSQVLKILHADGCKISSISPLKGLPLRTLTVSNTHLKDLSPLANSSIQILNISNTNVESIAPLNNLLIQKLYINNIRVKDFNSVKQLPLNELECDYTNFTNLRLLKNKLLTSLSMEGTRINNLFMLKDMPLEKLNVAFTFVRDISPLYQSRLQSLNLRGTPIRNFPDMTKLGSIRSLDLAGTTIQQIPILPALEFDLLDLSSTNISDISNLSPCIFSNLNLSFTKTKNLDALQGKNISQLSLEGTQVTDLGPLSGSLIKELDLSSTAVKSLTALENSRLRVLKLASTKVDSLHNLKKMRLRDLDVSNTRISLLTYLDLSLIRNLNISGTRLKEIDRLSEAAKLENLNLTDTQIKSISPLKGLPITTLILTNCLNLTSLQSLDSLKSLNYLILPDDFNRLEQISGLKDLMYIGKGSDEHWQSAEKFWDKHRRKE